MITNDAQLRQAVEQLQRLYRALATLKEEVLPRSVQRFTLMAEGPLDQVRVLQEQIDAYAGVVSAVENDADVWLRLVGTTLRWPDAPTSIMTAFLDNPNRGENDELQNRMLAKKPERDQPRDRW